MITEKKLKEILNKEIIFDVEAIEVVRKFIFDKTKKDIKGINRPQGIPCIVTQNGLPNITNDIKLMFDMFFIAKSHYLETINN